MVRTGHFTAKAWVQSLVKKLRFCKPGGVVRKKQNWSNNSVMMVMLVSAAAMATVWG